MAHAVLQMFHRFRQVVLSCMIFSSDELEILEYLKAWKGIAVPFAEISRCAGGRRKFRESPDWARGLMTRLVDAKLVTLNDRGHYRIIEENAAGSKSGTAESVPPQSFQVDDNYFPADVALAPEEPKGIVGEDYFPSPAAPKKNSETWISPQLKDLLKQAGWQLGPQTAEE
jgi:hypothetical protein